MTRESGIIKATHITYELCKMIQDWDLGTSERPEFIFMSHDVCELLSTLHSINMRIDYNRLERTFDGIPVMFVEGEGYIGVGIKIQ